MTTTDEKLIERIAQTLYVREMRAQGISAEWAESAWDDMGGSEPFEERMEWELRAAAILPIVRKAQAAAWEAGRLAGFSSGIDRLAPVVTPWDSPYLTEEMVP